MNTGGGSAVAALSIDSPTAHLILWGIKTEVPGLVSVEPFWAAVLPVLRMAKTFQVTLGAGDRLTCAQVVSHTAESGRARGATPCRFSAVWVGVRCVAV